MNNPSQKINESNGKKAKGRSLGESEESYRKLYEDAPIAYFSIGADNIIKNCNNATTNLLGYTKAEYLGKSIFDLYADRPGGLSKAKEIFEQFLKGKMILNKELQMKKKNGELIWISLTVNPILNDKGNIVESRSMVVNITERKKAEIKLKESEKKFQSLFEHMTAAFAYHKIILNEKNNPIDYVFLEANPAFEVFTGLNVNDIIGKKVTEILPGIENDPADWICVYGKVALTGESINFENYSEALDQWYSVSAYSPKKEYFAVTFINITEQKKAERQLKESEAKFKLLYENAPLGYQSLDENGYLLEVNKTWLNFFGYSKEEVIGKQFGDFLTQESQEQFKINFPIFKKEREMHEIEYKVRKKNGTYVFISIDGKCSYDNKEKFTRSHCILRDITEEKRAELRLEKERKKAESYLDLAGVIIIALNSKGEITLINKKGYDVLEYQEGELIGKNWFLTCLPPSMKNEVFEVFKKLMKGKTEAVEFYENPVLTKNSKEKIIAWHNIILREDDGRIIGILSSGEDITEHKKAEQKIQYQAMLVENVSDAILSLDMNYNIISWNKAAEKIYGWEAKEVIGKSLREIIPVEFPNDKKENIIRKFLEKGHWEGEGIQRKKNGTMINIFSSSTIFKDDSGKNIGMVTINRDITERKKAEQKIKESEEKYRTAYNRSNLYKDVFTHDINNILQNILSSLELSKLFSSDPERRQSFEEVTDLIYEQVIRGKLLVTNVQEFSKTEELTSSLFSIEALKVLKDTVESVKGEFTQKVIDIKIDSLLDNYFVKANELLNDVFVNILTNAIRHNNNPFKEISIKISKENYEGIQFIKFEFVDNGIGIPDSMKQLIFGREYKKEGIPSGIGLGLLLVEEILESYKGEIRVEDRIKGNFSEGSNFIITIPEAI